MGRKLGLLAFMMSMSFCAHAQSIDFLPLAEQKIIRGGELAKVECPISLDDRCLSFPQDVYRFRYQSAGCFKIRVLLCRMACNALQTVDGKGNEHLYLISTNSEFDDLIYEKVSCPASF